MFLFGVLSSKTRIHERQDPRFNKVYEESRLDPVKTFNRQQGQTQRCLSLNTREVLLMLWERRSILNSSEDLYDLTWEKVDEIIFFSYLSTME